MRRVELGAFLKSLRRAPDDEIEVVIAAAFDAGYYLRTNPDLDGGALGDLSPIRHYIDIGWREGRDPSAAFSTAYYLQRNPDVRESGVEPLFHYLRSGRSEGRHPTLAHQIVSSAAYRTITPEFDADFYRRNVPDLPGSADPVLHYMQEGWRAGHDPAPDFSTRFYLEQNPDVREQGINPFLHYLSIGREEGRPPTLRDRILRSEDYRLVASGLDAGFYRDGVPGLGDADPVLHYMQEGWRAGHDPAPDFSTRFYLDENPDVREQGINPFLHYLSIGREEGRPPTLRDQILRSEDYRLVASGLDAGFYRDAVPDLGDADPVLHYMQEGWRAGHDPAPDFSTRFYLEENPDVREQGMNPFLHYLSIGREEGRPPTLRDQILRSEDYRLVASGLDAGFYRDAVPGLGDADPVLHYMQEGWRAGHDPAPDFSTRFYLDENPDVREQGINPFLHYLSIGREEGRPPTLRDQILRSEDYRLIASGLDAGFYRDAVPGLGDADPVLHYMQEGWRAGHDPAPDFSTRFYLDENPDVREQGMNPFLHYLSIGREEGRPPTLRDQILRSEDYRLIASGLDAGFYRDAVPGLGDADPVLHYMQEGWRAGHDPAPDFSTRFYLDENPDVRQRGINPFLHYLNIGRKEGRPPTLRQRAERDDRRLLGTEFDADFYRETNADLADHPDPLTHFLGTGWREGRDPSAAFSTHFYLSGNPDVARLGVNPFLHYLRIGRAESRESRPSAARRARPATEPAPENRAPPRTAAVALVRNEFDVIGAFLGHLAALFDVIVVIDHGSDDGTLATLRAAAKAESAIHLYRLAEAGQVQALAVNHVLRTAPELAQVDWIFLIDAGEFLPFERRSDMDAALGRRASEPVIAVNRLNAVPARYAEGPFSLDDDLELYLPARPSPVRKIAFQPARLMRDRVWVTPGGHGILATEHGLPLDATPAGFSLIHLPIRSRSQFLRKLKPDGPRGRTHPEAPQISAEQKITDALLNAAAATCGAEGAAPDPLDHEALLARGFTLTRPAIARRPVALPELPSQPVQETDAATTGPDTRRDLPPDDRIGRLVTSDGVIRRAGDDGGHAFPALLPEPEADRAPPATSDSRFLADFLEPSYWPIETLTPSAWSGHIPFLFAVAALERPRRFVELGTHYGASFLAFCQTVRRLEFDCQPVAIDTWAGDAHAGHYDEAVFQSFAFDLRRYEDFAAYLRMLFSEAAPDFAEGSIDLLHIDGLHTYEAVRDDYETWLPKMSDRGVILFHDTAVRERGFGVWRLWEEIRDRHLSIELRHSHGLGIACVGARETGLARLIRMTRDEPALALLLEQHFEALGRLSVELFVQRSEIARREAQGRAFGQLDEELSRVRQALLTAEFGTRGAPRAPDLTSGRPGAAPPRPPAPAAGRRPTPARCRSRLARGQTACVRTGSSSSSAPAGLRLSPRLLPRS